jgi:hypothetical protein
VVKEEEEDGKKSMMALGDSFKNETKRLPR